jgi:oligopeptide/dipeptide ABC transporter ATP-binding protein
VVHGVRDVTVSIDAGETIGIVGESGAGKSTVGRMLVGLITPDHGTVQFEGRDTSAYTRSERQHFRSQARMVFQDPFTSLNPKLTVGECVAEPLRIHESLSGSALADRTAELFRSVGLRPDVVDRFPFEFSGGQLQRVAIARAIATRPTLVVCDEPVAALDVSIRAQVMNLLLELQDSSQVAYVFVSHDLSLVRAIADRVEVMYAGRVVESGAADRVFTDPKHPYTAALRDAIPSIVSGRRARQARPTPLALTASDEEGCAYRARCAYAVDACAVVPTLVEADGRWVACHVRPNLGAPT